MVWGLKNISTLRHVIERQIPATLYVRRLLSMGRQVGIDLRNALCDESGPHASASTDIIKNTYSV